MEEKERYKLESYNEAFCQIHDTESNEWYLRKDLVKDLLNQQDKRIKELQAKLAESENKVKGFVELFDKKQHENYEQFCEIMQLKQQLKDTEESYNNTMRYLNKTRSELLNLPKKIVEYFYDEIRHRAILEDDYCPDHNLERKYGVRKCLLENIRTTILKKYGGEDESNND